MDRNAANRAELKNLCRSFRHGHEPEITYTVRGGKLTWIRVSIVDAGFFLFLAK